jgi:hypothetical protein
MRPFRVKKNTFCTINDEIVVFVICLHFDSLIDILTIIISDVILERGFLAITLYIIINSKKKVIRNKHES